MNNVNTVEPVILYQFYNLKKRKLLTSPNVLYAIIKIDLILCIFFTTNDKLEQNCENKNRWSVHYSYAIIYIMLLILCKTKEPIMYIYYDLSVS